MTLSSGSHLGPYEILSPLGAGGMGEVYRARDTRLGREVAVKVLPAGLSQDADRLRRFEQEARAASALNHPNILVVHDSGRHGGASFLVTELLEGDSLRERLAGGPLPIRRALDIATQIARGLAAAHERGIVHRDLKPENLYVTRDGVVKILDFGLAKLLRPEMTGTQMAGAPTVGGTEPGIVLGTVGYMSPEQVRGQVADHRSDLFSFGAVLFEMLSGKRTFQRASAAETMNAILNEDPFELGEPGHRVPPSLERILRHCLEKNQDERFHSAHDLAFSLEALSSSSSVPLPGRRPARWRTALPWGLAAFLAVLLPMAARRPQRNVSPPSQVRRYVIPVPVIHPMAAAGLPSATTIVLSPDGSRLVYVAAAQDGDTQLHLRPMGEIEPKALAGSQGASAPFFSPDGRWIGFFAERKLKKLDLISGEVQILCDAKWPWGASWSTDGSIFFTPGSSVGIWRVSDQGSEPQAVAAPDYAKGERSYRFPETLPGGKALLYTVVSSGSGSSPAQTRIALLHLAPGERKVLVEDGSNARWAPSGHLVYARAGALLAATFDLASLTVTGPPVPIIDSVWTDSGTAAAQFGLASDGTLAYVPGGVQGRRRHLVWVDRQGKEQPLTEAQRDYANLSVSPDGRYVAVGVAEGANADVWVEDLRRHTSTRLTTDAAIDHMPVWTPDGERVAFGSNRAGAMDLYWIPADGSEPETPLLALPNAQWPSSWSPDGKLLSYTEEDLAMGFDIWTLDLEGERRPFLRTSFNERAARFSPDGKWLAYTSDESGRDEIYVRPFPGPGQKFKISSDGGAEPAWAQRGGELFYRSGNRVMAVKVTTEPTFLAETPRILFAGDYERAGPLIFAYDVTADGQRFAMIRSQRSSAPASVHVVLDWFAELERRVPHAGLSP